MYILYMYDIVHSFERIVYPFVSHFADLSEYYKN